MNPDAALLWALLAVPVLLRLTRLRLLTQTQAQQLLGTSVRNEGAEGRRGQQFLMEAADVASALEHVSTVGRPMLQHFLDRRSNLEVPWSHSIRLATASTQQVSSAGDAWAVMPSADVCKQSATRFWYGANAAARHLVECFSLYVSSLPCLGISINRPYADS